jgi:hypothetical protein
MHNHVLNDYLYCTGGSTTRSGTNKPGTHAVSSSTAARTTNTHRAEEVRARQGKWARTSATRAAGPATRACPFAAGKARQGRVAGVHPVVHPCAGLDIELARLGSVRLELARYNNELARLDSL